MGLRHWEQSRFLELMGLQWFQDLVGLQHWEQSGFQELGAIWVGSEIVFPRFLSMYGAASVFFSSNAAI